MEDCEAPRIRNSKLKLELKEGAVCHAAQPIPSGAPDQMRVDFRVWEEVQFEKRVYHDSAKHELPEWRFALFVVDQRGKGVLGRMATAYAHLKDNILNSTAASPDVEGACQPAAGCGFHSKMDVVWVY